MLRKRFLATALLLIPVFAGAQTLEYTETDPIFETGARVGAGASVNLIPKTLELSVNEQLRVTDNFSRFQRSYTTVGLDAKILPWLKAGVSYSLIANNSVSSGWSLRHRGAVSLTETVSNGIIQL